MKLFSLGILVASCVIVYGSVLKKSNSTDGVYEIIDGSCYSALAKDLIFHDHVHKTRLPLVSREATSSWQGNQKIYCLKVLNEKDESKGATCKITKGGVGYNNVTVEMHSAKNHGLEFDIQVYVR